MPMNVPEPSWRKPVGMLLLLALIGLWAVVVVTFVEWLALPEWATPIAFIVGGFAWLWLFPTKRMLRWMELGKWRE